MILIIFERIKQNIMFGDMMGKLQEMQQKMEEQKLKLDKIHVAGESADGKIRVTATGNKKIIDISIDESICGEKEMLEDMIMVAVNRALEKAESESQDTMGDMAKGMFPDLPM